MAGSNYLIKTAQALGFMYDANTATVFGARGGYSFVLQQMNQTKRFNISVSVRRGGELPVREALQPFVKASQFLTDGAVNGTLLIFTTRNKTGQAQAMETTCRAVEEIAAFLQTNQFENCCRACGEVKPTEACSVSGVVNLLCAECFTEASLHTEAARQTHEQKAENVLAGAVGALLGALIGVVCIVVIGQLGYVSAISGIVMGVCTLKGYELLGHKQSVKGIVISVVLMLLLVFLGNQIDWAVSIAAYYEIDFFSAFRLVLPMLAEGYLDNGAFVLNIVLLYVFSALGAVPTILGALRHRKVAFTTYKLANGFASAAASVQAEQPARNEQDVPWEQ